MNVYRLVGDMSHLFAILFLLFKICKTRSCAGISGKSQLLYLMVFLTRYLDLFYCFISYYNTFLKLLFVGSTALTVLLIFVVFKSTYDSVNDTFRVVYLLLPAAVLAFYVNHVFEFLEVLWTFSIYLEAVVIIPQFFMIRRTGEMEMFTYHYLFALGLYRAFYIFNWVYRYSYEGYFDSIAFLAGCVQTAFYCYFLYTKEFLKRQARAYFQLHSQGTENAEIEKVGKETLLQAANDDLEERPSSTVIHVDNIVVPCQGDDNMNRSQQQLNPADSSVDQSAVAEAAQGAECVCGSFPNIAVDQTPGGEGISNSPPELRQNQSQ